MSLFGSGNQQNAQQTQPLGAFSFGAATSSAPTPLTSQAGTTNLFGGTGNTSTFGGFGATTTTSSLFGGTQTAPSFSATPSLFPSTTTTTSSAFSSFGQPTTTQATGGFSFGGSTLGQPATSANTGFSFGAPTLGQTSAAPATGGFSLGTSGFGNPVSSSGTFGINSLAPVSTSVPSTSSATIGLGGVDIQASSGLSSGNTPNKKDGKAVKELQIPNEISVTVESFKKYVKQQKAIREEMSRVSSKNLFKVQELVANLKQQLSVVSNGLQRNTKAIVKLKEESNQELKNAEIAQRNKDALTAMQYENNAPTEYFHNLANSFEKQMQSYRQQIEQLERHLLSLSLPYTLTPNEWTTIRKKLHDTFVTLAAHLQTVHQEVQICKEHFINQKTNQDDMRIFLEKHRENIKDSPYVNLQASVSYGPSPFAAMQSAVGKAITNVFNRSQQLPGGASPHMMLSSLNSSRFNSMQSLSPYKPLGQTGMPSFGTSNLIDTTGFSSDPNQSQFALNSQKPFQLQKPPAGNKRGKRDPTS